MKNGARCKLMFCQECGDYLPYQRRYWPYCDLCVLEHLEERGMPLPTDPRKNAATSVYCKKIESLIGRRLTRGEVVHHRDLNHRNNDDNNLQLMTGREHRSLHMLLQSHLHTTATPGATGRQPVAK